nr:DpnII family type II restriction endonuclease [Candidatus Sigynarchaeota archaeon]
LKNGVELISQQSMKSVPASYDIVFPSELLNRKCDFLLVKNKKFLNIEVNYYEGAGSKPEEIVDSYIERYNEIKKAGGCFIWISDGPVWTIAQSQIRKAFDKMPYIFNFFFVKRGLLEGAIKKFFGT